MAQETKVSDKHTFIFWSTHFPNAKTVKISDFSTAFVKRFQSGEGGYPVYPAAILYRIVDHFIARKDDLSEPAEITTSDIATFSNRFGSLPQAVQLIVENFFDPRGDVHMWYHFSIPSHVLDRKLLTENSSCWLLRDSGSQPGNFVLVLRKAKGGKKEILIENIKDKESGKMKYGTKATAEDDVASVIARTTSPTPAERSVSPGGKGKHVELRMFTGSLLDFLRERTSAFIPVCSQLYLATHQDYIAAESKKISPGEPLSSQTSDDRHKGYAVPKGTEINFVEYSTYAADRGEKHKAANSRYKNFWQGDNASSGGGSSGGNYTPDGGAYTPPLSSVPTTAQSGKSDPNLTKYVSGLLLTGKK